MQRLMRFLWFAESTRQAVQQNPAQDIFAQNSLLHCWQFLCTNFPSLRQVFWLLHCVLIIARFYAVMGPAYPPGIKRACLPYSVTRRGPSRREHESPVDDFGPLAASRLFFAIRNAARSVFRS